MDGETLRGAAMSFVGMIEWGLFCFILGMMVLFELQEWRVGRKGPMRRFFEWVARMIHEAEKRNR